MKEQINGWLARDSWGSLTFTNRSQKGFPERGWDFGILIPEGI